ncbi:hypothetical protein J1605_009377 [Eschrichtius robustus]|uniref:Rho guanine nucleotide exchange factor 7 n=1 Tax=Eschrichtius robustus TaxID=9764 RepID=A0AB34GUZ0_ESCRO|nr:hypothetical protein J1605_009377 [Eschrichtius robustus]
MGSVILQDPEVVPPSQWPGAASSHSLQSSPGGGGGRAALLSSNGGLSSPPRVLRVVSEELGEFMEMKGASSPGILMLTTGLSKPFMRLDKYPALLKELERHMEDYHPDRQDIQKSMTAFKNLSAQCQEVRKRKELELQILTEAIRSWEGDDIKTLGNVIYMSQVLIQCAGSEEKNERYLLLFPNILLMLSASPRMSGFIYQGKLPTTGMTITKLEDSENHRNAFEISGSMIERILVSCSDQQDLHEWVDRLQKQTKVTSAGNPAVKPHPVPSHTVRAPAPLPPPDAGLSLGFGCQQVIKGFKA